MPTGKLPASGKKLWEEVYDTALKGSCKGDKQCAAGSAWKAVKNAGWSEDKDGNWHKKAELEEFALTIKRISIDPVTQEKRWKADTSDVVEDTRGDNMTVELFKSFTDRISRNEPAPVEFKSEFWDGGMPYLSVSHYSDQNGKGVPGQVDVVYIDGRFLKAKGTFSNTPLGEAAWKAVLKDKETDRPDKVRISIGFLDFGHIHKSNNYVFKRQSVEDDMCPECLKEIITEAITGEKSSAGKAYTDGMLVHLAMTRVPVNKRTSISPDLEVRAEMTTRKEDAASIIGDELATEIEEAELKLKSKSLVEFSDVVEEAKTKKPVDEETPAEDTGEDEMCEEGDCADKKKKMKSEVDESAIEVDLAVTKKEKDCAHPASHYLVVEDAQKTTTWHLRVKDCNGKPDHNLMGEAWAALHSNFRGHGYSGPNKSAAISKLKRMYSSENLDTPSKADIELADLIETVNEMKEKLMGEKQESTVQEVQLDEVQKSELYPAIKDFIQAFEEVKKSNLPEDDMLRSIQEPFNVLGNAVISKVKKPVEPKKEEPQNDLVKALSEVMTPIAQKLDLLLAQREQDSIPSRVPPRRSLAPAIVAPQLLAKEAEVTNADPNKPISITNFAAKSVGLQ